MVRRLTLKRKRVTVDVSTATERHEEDPVRITNGREHAAELRALAVSALRMGKVDEAHALEREAHRLDPR